MTILQPDLEGFAATVPVMVIGAGAAGHVAALAAREAGAEVVMLERDSLPAGSTALSSGLIPAAGTKAQAAAGVVDSPDRFAADILAKNRGLSDPGLVATLAATSGPAIDWLSERHGVPLSLVEGPLYPGHSVLRMHATPRRTGAELMGYLGTAATRAGVEIITDACATALYADAEGCLHGVRIARPDGSTEAIGCQALILACCGFGANPEMIARYIPEMTEGYAFGHPGNKGDGIRWGQELGAAVRDMGAYQGHAGIAVPHSILITWALITEGAIQVNVDGRRFGNEADGHSERAASILQQPGRVAFDIYDEDRHAVGLDFEDYRAALAAGAIRQGDDAAGLAEALGLPPDALAETLAEVEAMAAGRRADPFGRDFTTRPELIPPYFGVKVTGAMFHTQGGLVVDASARVQRAKGGRFPNLFAAGGTAAGVSGPGAWGYLSGNGLLSAIGLGRIAGREAGTLIAT